MSVYVANHIHDLLRAEREQLPHERLVTALWVYDKRDSLSSAGGGEGEAPARAEHLSQFRW